MVSLDILEFSCDSPRSSIKAVALSMDKMMSSVSFQNLFLITSCGVLCTL